MLFLKGAIFVLPPICFAANCAENPVSLAVLPPPIIAQKHRALPALPSPDPPQQRRLVLPSPDPTDLETAWRWLPHSQAMASTSLSTRAGRRTDGREWRARSAAPSVLRLALGARRAKRGAPQGSVGGSRPIAQLQQTFRSRHVEAGRLSSGSLKLVVLVVFHPQYTNGNNIYSIIQ